MFGKKSAKNLNSGTNSNKGNSANGNSINERNAGKNSAAGAYSQGSAAGEKLSLSVSARCGRLKFHKSGKFRILQLADIQDGADVSKDTINLIAAACDAAKPDIVVFTGDQIAGYASDYAATYRARRWEGETETVARNVGIWVENSLRAVSGANDSSDLSESGSSSNNSASSANSGSGNSGSGNSGSVYLSSTENSDEKQQNEKHSAEPEQISKTQISKNQTSKNPAEKKSFGMRKSRRKPTASDFAQTRELVRKSISEFLAPIVERGIPFAVTHGNHDFQCGLSNAELEAIYREFPGCLNPEAIAANPAAQRHVPASGMQAQTVYACEPGSFVLPVCDVDEKKNVIGIALVDSGDYAREGGYGVPDRQALDFLRAIPQLIGVKSILFQHIPMPQNYRLLRKVSHLTANAIQGYRAFDDGCYVLDEDVVQPGSYLGEGISCPDTDCGEFDILKESDGYFAVFTGHDHRNGYVGTADGIMLGTTPTCGFGSYGPVPSKRAVRLFEFDIRHPYEPRTQLLTFGRLVGKPKSAAAYTFAMSRIPVSKGEAVDLLRKPKVSVTLGTVAAAVVWLVSAIKGRKRK